MKKKLKVILIVAIIVILAIAIFAGRTIVSELKGSQQSSQSRYSGNSGPSKPIEFGIAGEEDYANLEEILLSSQMIKDLPSNGVLLLNFYNFYSGEREWEKSYTIKKDSVVLGEPDEYDIKLIMASKYLTILNDYGLCSTINIARSRGDFASQTALSTTSLLWKYRSMTKYRDCLGI